MDCPAGSGIITKLGWDKNDEGKDVFRAIIEFPNGPPDLNALVVWDQKPVTISLTPEI